jgi:hypothetical protein
LLLNKINSTAGEKWTLYRVLTDAGFVCNKAPKRAAIFKDMTIRPVYIDKVLSDLSEPCGLSLSVSVTIFARKVVTLMLQ